jgi:hypothetical protein
MVKSSSEASMLFRLTYACVCGNQWEITHHDSLQVKCATCGLKSWPAEMREALKSTVAPVSNPQEEEQQGDLFK